MNFGNLGNLFNPVPEPQLTSEIRDRRTSQKSGLSKQKLGVRNPKEQDRAITDEYKMNISQLKGSMLRRKKAWEQSQKDGASKELQQFYKNQYDYYKMVFDLRNKGKVDMNKLHSYSFLDDRKEIINSDRQRLQKQLDNLGRDANNKEAEKLKNLLRKLDEEQKNIEEVQRINRENNEAEKEKRKEQMEKDEEEKFEEKDKRPKLNEMDDESLKRYKENLQKQLQDAKDPNIQDGMKNNLNEIEKEEKKRQSKAQEDAEKNARLQANLEAEKKDKENTRKGRDAGTKGDEEDTNIPINHTDLHNDSSKHQEQNNKDGQNDTMTHNIAPNTTKYGDGQDEDAPTYQGKHNRASQISTKVVDALSDVIIKDLMTNNNRRRLLSIRGDLKNYVDGFNFATGMMTDPLGTMIKGGVAMGKKKLDGLDGTNVFEELSNLGKLSVDEEEDIEVSKTEQNKPMSKMFSMGETGDLYAQKAMEFLQSKMDGTFQTSKPNRMTLSSDTEGEMVFIKSPVIMPFIIITIVLYIALHNKSFSVLSINSLVNSVVRKGIEYVFKYILKMDNNLVEYGFGILNNIPQQLITAFIRNIDKKVGLTDDERERIDGFVRVYIVKAYERLYNEPLDKAMKHFQGNNMPLYQYLTELGSDDVLHSIAVQLKTADLLVWEAVNNTGVFLGLIELASIHHKGMEDLYINDRDIGKEFYVDGVVSYLGKTAKIRQFEDIGLNALVDIQRNNGKNKIKGSDRVGLYKNGNDYVVAIKGSELPKDLGTNFENIAGSKEVLNSKRFKEGDELLDEAQKLANRSGGKVKLVGHSLGGLISSFLASKHQSVEADIYDPIIARNKQTDKLFKELQHSNIRFHQIENSPISQYLEEYAIKNNILLKKYKQKRMSSHSLMNFLQ